MQPKGKEPTDFMEEMARCSQLLQGHLSLTEEILENMHRITITMAKKSLDPDAVQKVPGNESHRASDRA